MSIVSSIYYFLKVRLLPNRAERTKALLDNLHSSPQLSQQANWLLEAVTPAAGMEMEKMSLLGAVLSLSVFAEDDVSLPALML